MGRMGKPETQTALKEGWETTKLRTSLMEQVRKHVKDAKEYGAPKYASVPDFIQKACKELLKADGVSA